MLKNQGAEKTIKLRDGLLTEIRLWDDGILDEGGKAIL